MNKLIYFLLAIPLLFASCNNNDLTAEESVQVAFKAQIPGKIDSRANSRGANRVGTRAIGDLKVDKVVCAVFENGTEITNLRQVINVTNDMVFAPRLIKGRTYNIVFWAMQDGCYDVSDLTAIKRAAKDGTSEDDYEAFTTSVSVTVTDSDAQIVELKRPYAQLNIGVNETDWNTVVNTFGLTPEKMVFSTTGKNAFNALTGAATGDDTNISLTVTSSGSELVVDETTYKNIGTFYIFPEESQANFDINFSVYAAGNEPIRENVNISNVPLQANYRTNVVGGLLTGTVTYTIFIKEGFNTDNNQTIGK